MRPFARWMVLRRARNRARSRTFTEASASWARQQIHAALDFLAWLDQHGLDLAQAAQPDIDAWLTSGSTQRYTVRYFLDWGPVDQPHRQMKASQLSHSDDRRAYTTATPTAVLGGRGGPTTWLFPGQVPGRHLAVNGLVRQLNEHGIQARISRSAALINLAADLPASVLSDLLGIHINTAVRWAHRAKRDWTSYPAARAAPVGEPMNRADG